MKRNSKKEKGQEQHESISIIGEIIDLPLEEFEKELIRQKVNIGTINNLILSLESVYYDLRTRKDAILKMCFENTLEKSEGQTIVNNLYAEMIKAEQKIVYLKQRSKELIDVDNTPN